MNSACIIPYMIDDDVLCTCGIYCTSVRPRERDPSSVALPQLKPISFLSNISKMNFMLGLLRGKALSWAEARFARGALEGVTFSDFIEEFHLVFDCPDNYFSASSRLMGITQGRCSVADYTLEFQTPPANVDWTLPSVTG
ncbi:hypothetical protein L3Q82_008375 [Scortum barcoo]|uniref:Uncharacterized protein n=1 Tax=Scortum barcoo TaxID=214431 RepID=A0ACB8WHY8_9TELE|nr:hypothetical protein L3Q82_008375 [Scortum barcoo]